VTISSPLLSAEIENQPIQTGVDGAGGAAPSRQSPADVGYSIRPGKVAGALIVVVLGLVLASTFARLAVSYVGPDRYRGLMEFALRFDLDHEINIPTWYSSCTLLCCAVLLAAITVARKQAGCRYAVHWGLLALAFLFLSVDETANLHEILIVPLRRRLGAQGLLYFAWVIPGAVLVGAFALAYVRFLLELDKRTRYLFLAAGAAYVGGALGMEMVGGACADWYGLESMRYLAAMTVEESLEMLGIVIFLYALFDYIRRQTGQWRIGFSPPRREG